MAESVTRLSVLAAGFFIRSASWDSARLIVLVDRFQDLNSRNFQLKY